MTKADKVVTETMMAETMAGFQAVLSELDAQVGQLKRDVAGKADSSTVEAVSKTVTTEVKIIKKNIYRIHYCPVSTKTREMRPVSLHMSCENASL